jgi:hypothetical protein
MDGGLLGPIDNRLEAWSNMEVDTFGLRFLQFVAGTDRTHRTKFGLSHCATEQTTEDRNFGFFGFSVGFFWYGLRFSVFMPTPSMQLGSVVVTLIFLSSCNIFFLSL